jgi:hypothetical protein
MIVELREHDACYPDLTQGQPYVVLGIEADDLQILNDQGRPYLYPPEIFTIADTREQEDWVTEFGEDDKRYSYPPPSTVPDSSRTISTASPEAVATFWRATNRCLSAAA